MITTELIKFRISHEFVRLMDLMPTIIDWAGGELRLNLDAISMMKLLNHHIVLLQKEIVMVTPRPMIGCLN